MPRTTPAVAAVLRRLAGPVTSAVTEVAAGLLSAQRRLRPGDIQRKARGDFVTTVDLRAERKLRRVLCSLLPAAGFLGEETPTAALAADWLWVVDPIDGTSNFARGLPHFAVAVALLYQGDPQLAVVHCFPEDCSYVGQRGRGLRRICGQRRPTRVQLPPGRINDAGILGCQWHRGQQDMRFLAALQQRGCRIRTLGSTVTQLVDLLAGRLDGNVQQQGRIWDLAAAGLLVEEGGGRLTDWQGQSVLPFRDLTVEHIPTVAASPAAHRVLLRLLSSCQS